MVFESFSREDTFNIAKDFGSKAKAGQVYCLTGDLGTGKTVFSGGFAAGLDVLGYITSPTFTIINEYKGRLPFYHFDVYRIRTPYEMEDTGYEDYFYGNGVCIVEWGELIMELLPRDVVFVVVEKDMSKGEDYRKITINDKKVGV